MSRPLFSIITIAFNSSATIERTIMSVLTQTYKDYEYLIVDGASTDETVDIIRKYEPLFEGRLKWTSEPDKGIYNAMNKGIKKATGELIGIVNSDDWMEPTALESINKLASEHEDKANCIFCGSLRFHYNNGVEQVLYADKERFEKGIKKHSHGYGIYHPATFVGKGVYEKVGLYDEYLSVASDADFLYKCYMSSIFFFFTKDVISNMADGGVSNSPNYKRFIKENTQRLKASKKSKVAILYYNMCGCLKLALKQIMPTSMLIRYRSAKQK